MQIDRYNHLLFPRDNTSASTGKESSATAGAQGGGSLPARLPLAAGEPVALRAEGVVLKIQRPDTAAIRSEGSVYNKDGVLSARAQPAAQDKQPDFVALAVSAMREFSDEAERLKAALPPAATEGPTAGMGWGKLQGLQQLAARFKAFA